MLLRLNFFKVITFRFFLFSLPFCSTIYFQYHKNEYVFSDAIITYSFSFGIFSSKIESDCKLHVMKGVINV